MQQLFWLHYEFLQDVKVHKKSPCVLCLKTLFIYSTQQVKTHILTAVATRINDSPFLNWDRANSQSRWLRSP